MEIYANNNLKTINEGELQMLANRIQNFVNTYTKHIYVDDKTELTALSKLQNISNIIKAKRYNEIFDEDTIVVSGDDKCIENMEDVISDLLLPF